MAHQLTSSDESFVEQLGVLTPIGIFRDTLLAVGDDEGDYASEATRNYEGDSYQVKSVLGFPGANTADSGPI
ncbi:hypothetical protein [Catellatospora chokoriensis]|uniref:Uncharacterized protein n=1 Tax=Catellatospora chokoriensis TaxID=310353 RepID=A0A8J3JUM2_9ACTN|nr:hypothetical protein [Catellatospora chokoriensis]GIF91371.1 hypothetical protein Cch02nite_48150 [Catellatospora chokoriensis]